MAKPKTSLAQVKPSKQSAKGTTVASFLKQANLSRELVSDSDSADDGNDSDEDEEINKTPQRKITVTPVKQTNGSTTKSTPKSSQKSKPTPAESEDEGSEEESSEEESSEDEDSSEESETAAVQQHMPKRPDVTPSKVNGVKRKVDEQTSSEEETSEQSDNDSAPEPQAKKARTTKPSTDEEEEEDESNNSKPQLPPSTPKPSSNPPPTNQPSPRSQTQPIRPGQFLPPKGFTPLPSLPPNPNLTASALTNKQVWYLTAPSSLPLSSLTTLTPSALSSGAIVLRHEGTSYSFKPPDPDDGDDALSPSVSLLVPSAGRDHATYALAPAAITRSLHLRLHLELPVLDWRRVDPSTGGDAAAAVSAAPVSTVRPQPKNLRMRYRPPGFGRGDPGVIGEGSEDEGGSEGGSEGAGGFQFPRALGVHGGVTEGGKDEGRGKKKGKNKEKKVDGGIREDDEVKGKKGEKFARKEEKRARKEAKAKAREMVEGATK